jgi:hypothetical protein
MASHHHHGAITIMVTTATATSTASSILLSHLRRDPLGITFLFARKPPSNRFSFGYGRVEDLAGLAVLLTILASAIVAGYESVERFLHPKDITHLWAVALASIIGLMHRSKQHLYSITSSARASSRRAILRPNPIVWVEAGRLQRALEHYYAVNSGRPARSRLFDTSELDTIHSKKQKSIIRNQTQIAQTRLRSGLSCVGSTIYAPQP